MHRPADPARHGPEPKLERSDALRVLRECHLHVQQLEHVVRARQGAAQLQRDLPARGQVEDAARVAEMRSK